MNDPASETFYVAVLAAADEADLIADIVFAGQQVADVSRIDGCWTVTLYDPSGAEGFKLPLVELRAALRDAARRLQAE
jgi:hypothetical protein